MGAADVGCSVNQAVTRRSVAMVISPRRWQYWSRLNADRALDAVKCSLQQGTRRGEGESGVVVNRESGPEC